MTFSRSLSECYSRKWFKQEVDISIFIFSSLNKLNSYLLKFNKLHIYLLKLKEKSPELEPNFGSWNWRGQTRERRDPTSVEEESHIAAAHTLCVAST